MPQESHTTASGDTITFEPETVGAKEGKIKWMGIVKDDVIDVTYTWHRAPKWYRFSNAPVECWFKGELNSQFSASGKETR